MTDVYRYWRKALKGEETREHMLPTSGPIGAEGVPQAGLWKINTGGGYRDGVKQPKTFVPMQIWMQDYLTGVVVHLWREGLVLGGLIDHEPATADQIERRWLGCEPLSKADRDFYVAEGRWPEDPPEPVQAPAIAETETIVVMSFTGPPSRHPVASATPGHNSGDTSSFQTMREQIKGEISEAQNYFTRNPIKIKADADKCENWRKRIYDLMKKADDQRDAEKRPHMEKANEIQALWKPLIDEAKAGAQSLQTTVDIWDRAETARRRKEAEDEARARLEAEREKQAEARRLAEEERQRVEAERTEMELNDPIAALTGSLPELPELPPEPEPIPDTIMVDVPKTMYGTTGNRRSAKAAPATATIVDLKAAAAFYAEQNHPDLIALIQKLADRACKANAPIPGIHMSWQMKSEVAE